LDVLDAISVRAIKSLAEKARRGETFTTDDVRTVRSLRAMLVSKAAQEDADRAAPGQGEVLTTLMAVAKAMGVTERTVRNWRKSGMPVRSDGRFDLGAIRTWRARGGKGLSGAHYRRERDKWEAKYREIKARLATLELKQRTGQLLPRERVEGKRVRQIQATKQALLAVPAAVAPQLVGLDPREIQALLRDRITDAISRLAEK